MDAFFFGDSWITPFGIIFVLSGVIMWWGTRRNAVHVDIDTSHIDLLVPLAIFTGVIGGALLTVFTPNDRYLAGEALQTWLRIRLFGMATAGAVAVFVYSRLNDFSFRSLLDLLALPTVAALAVHRVGCFLAGCCWGDISVHSNELFLLSQSALGLQVQTLPWLAGDWVVWAAQYPPETFAFQQQVALGLISADAASSLPVHPVQLYEAALLVGLMLLVRKLPLNHFPRGTIAAYVAAGYAFIRFLLEFLRADANLVIGPLTMPQVQCVLLLIAVAVALKVQSNFRRRIA